MRTSITSKSTAADVNAQENILTEAMGKIMAVAEGYPELKANENYIKTMDSVSTMLRIKQNQAKNTQTTILPGMFSVMRSFSLCEEGYHEKLA